MTRESVAGDPGRPQLAVTMGDPAGVGPEVVVKALADPEIAALAEYVVVGEAWPLREAANVAGLEPPGGVHTLDAVRRGDFAPGMLSTACGLAAVAFVEAATRMRT